MVLLKYLRNFWRTLEMPLINCEITLDLNWSENCVIYVAAQATTVSITDTKLYQLNSTQYHYYQLAIIQNCLTKTASATDAAIHKKIFGSGFTTLMISNEEVNDIMKIVKSL